MVMIFEQCDGTRKVGKDSTAKKKSKKENKHLYRISQSVEQQNQDKIK